MVKKKICSNDRGLSATKYILTLYRKIMKNRTEEQTEDLEE